MLLKARKFPKDKFLVSDETSRLNSSKESP